MLSQRHEKWRMRWKFVKKQWQRVNPTAVVTCMENLMETHRKNALSGKNDPEEINMSTAKGEISALRFLIICSIEISTYDMLRKQECLYLE